MSTSDPQSAPRDPWMVEGYGAQQGDPSQPTDPSLFRQSLKRLKTTIPHPSDSWPQPGAQEAVKRDMSSPEQMAVTVGILAVAGVICILIGLLQRHAINTWELTGGIALTLWLWLRAVVTTPKGGKE